MRAARNSDAGGAEAVLVTRPHDDERFILLLEEEQELVVFAVIVGQQGRSASNEEMSDAVVTLLRMRKLRNATAAQDGRAVFPLSNAAEKVISTGRVSSHWANGFKVRHGHVLT